MSHSAPIVRAQDKGARILALPPSLGCFGAGARGPGSLGLAPVVATASFPLINLPKFYLSFTILVSLILVKYPDRVGLVNTAVTIPVPCSWLPRAGLSTSSLDSSILRARKTYNTPAQGVNASCLHAPAT